MRIPCRFWCAFRAPRAPADLLVRVRACAPTVFPCILTLPSVLSKEIKVGLLALLALIILFVGFNYLRGSNVLSSSHTYFAKYASVDGLNIGAPVVFNGIKVGQVKNLELLPEEGNKVKATMELEKSIVVGDSTVASLAGSLLGTKTITLFMGKNSKTFTGGEELKSFTVASITDAFQACPVGKYHSVLPVAASAAANVPPDSP